MNLRGRGGPLAQAILRAAESGMVASYHGGPLLGNLRFAQQQCRLLSRDHRHRNYCPDSRPSSGCVACVDGARVCYLDSSITRSHREPRHQNGSPTDADTA